MLRRDFADRAQDLNGIARIAQLAEQDTLNVKVPSSILGAGTKLVRLRFVLRIEYSVLCKKIKRNTQYAIRNTKNAWHYIRRD